MVQYVFTPWRDRHELLLVRRQFYGAYSPPFPGCNTGFSGNSSTTTTTASKPTSISARGPETPHDHYALGHVADADARKVRQDQHQAVARVSMWMQRGHCPHMVESTALLTAAVLSDEDDVDVAAEHTASSTYAIRAAYSAAFSRFVTGLLDGHQDKQRKQSMYAIAKTIGLPAAFVELRHQSTHEQLPSRAKLRSAAKKALFWIWDYYWKHLPDEPFSDRPRDECTESVYQYLRIDDETRREAARQDLHRWPREQLIASVAELRRSLPGNQAYIKCMQLHQELLEEKTSQSKGDLSMEDANDTANQTAQSSGDTESPDVDQAAIAQQQDADQDADLDTGWSRYEGPWQPKPIGIQAPFVIHSTSTLISVPMNRLLSRNTLLKTKLNSIRAPVSDMPLLTLDRVGTGNNYSYLVVDDKSKDAVIIDPANPPEVTPILKEAIQSGNINLTAILHELGTPDLDIIGGKDCAGVTKTPAHESTFKLGSITVKAVHTPCHTQDSICYFMEDGDQKAVFTGDTLFISGCGKFFEGTAPQMHEALNKRLASLPDDTLVYPGHEYTKSNVKFTVSVLQNEAVKSLEAFADANRVTTGKFTIGDEKRHNVFMRVEDPEVQKATGKTDPVEVMAALREMKNNFKPEHARLRPPKRKSGGATAAAAPKTRQSKLAKEHNVTAQEEGEIKEAFSLFAEPMDGEKNGVLPVDDVKSALIALGIPPSSNAELREFLSILDPEEDGYATYEPFFAICALKFHTREHDSSAHRAELEEAFRLFTNGQDGPITLAHLRRVAAVLKEDVDDEMLKDMILEANGGAGVARGVEMDEFDGVMRSAGAWR
ncbi:Las1-like-domain-containing protein [Stachybotrys elegans]|uniref:hydroxyacylglutathione hydrolase n=1 Tax=Stachybotrys elegans TaxID=80388 RepID=A0A8K0WSM0_9HYPO|nr:Las1-like-domain-containing protein [Stachybotrys elegans]